MNDTYKRVEDDDPIFWTPTEAARNAYYEMWDDDLSITESDGSEEQ